MAININNLDLSDEFLFDDNKDSADNLRDLTSQELNLSGGEVYTFSLNTSFDPFTQTKKLKYYIDDNGKVTSGTLN